MSRAPSALIKRPMPTGPSMSISSANLPCGRVKPPRRGATTMGAAIDIDAYFRRIDYAGERTPTIDTLRAIVVRHMEAIPFENLNPLLRWPVRLDPTSLEQK